MILDNLLCLIKPVGKIFLVDRKGNSLAKINANEIEKIQEYKNKEVSELYCSNVTEGMILFPVLVIEIEIEWSDKDE